MLKPKGLAERVKTAQKVGKKHEGMMDLAVGYQAECFNARLQKS